MYMHTFAVVTEIEYFLENLYNISTKIKFQRISSELQLQTIVN